MDVETASDGEVDYPFLVEDWGNTDYDEAFEKQKVYVRERIDGNRQDTLIFTEHLPVYTMGVRKGAENHLIWNESTLSEKGISLHKTNRGGDITYHGPGQLTAYPIMNLEKASRPACIPPLNGRCAHWHRGTLRAKGRTPRRKDRDMDRATKDRCYWRSRKIMG